MLKRQAPECLDRGRPIKRLRHDTDQISKLSDELLVRIFENVSVNTITICQRVSRRFQRIACDSQIWRLAYYHRFVRPRTHRLAGMRSQGTMPIKGLRSSRFSKWLDEEELVRRGEKTNWKRQYKIRHNWCRGSCDISEIPVAERALRPPLLARLHKGYVYTVDSVSGIRAWSYKHEDRLLAHTELQPPAGTERKSLPTSFTLDMGARDDHSQRLVIGFENGSFALYSFNTSLHHFSHLYTHPPSSNGALSALAFVSPYILTMFETQTLSLYRISDATHGPAATQTMEAPRLLTSLKSHTAWPPLSLSLRFNASIVVASIAYSLRTYQSGWSVGVQELHLTPEGELLNSRLAASHNQGFVPLSSKSLLSTSSPDIQALQPSITLSHTFSKPTSLSYAHPYLLVSHSDNTLTVYLVTSSSSKLSIDAGRRLWGHTSSVFGAQVGGRGKAVSVSTRGNEVRVWELEGRTLFSKGRNAIKEDLSVRVIPENTPQPMNSLSLISEAITRRGPALGLALDEASDDMAITRGWVGFDEENVVVLREQRHGHQALMIYDFT